MCGVGMCGARPSQLPGRANGEPRYGVRRRCRHGFGSRCTAAGHAAPGRAGRVPGWKESLASIQCRLMMSWKMTAGFPGPTVPASTALLDHAAVETLQSWQLNKDEKNEKTTYPTYPKLAAKFPSHWKNWAGPVFRIKHEKITAQSSQSCCAPRVCF